MIWLFAVIIILGSVGVITYPLFRSKIQKYEIPENYQLDSSQADFYLTALSDLENDYALGHISESDYNQQKIIFQRNYLKLQKKEVSTENLQ
tara:strand:+ start:967 stop:1242 length:276 start_codon:yes stop_codon:yes gene_type:complete